MDWFWVFIRWLGAFLSRCPAAAARAAGFTSAVFGRRCEAWRAAIETQIPVVDWMTLGPWRAMGFRPAWMPAPVAMVVLRRRSGRREAGGDSLFLSGPWPAFDGPAIRSKSAHSAGD
jgi:hypothetical protein